MKKSDNKSNLRLSIIILNFNTRKLLDDCLASLTTIRKEVGFEVIVVDNASMDDSVAMVEEKYGWTKLIRSNTNKGFSAGNNMARKYARGEYILFLNSDTTVPSMTLKTSVQFMDAHPDIGAMTCKTILPSGNVDKDARRSFPTPWVALSHFLYFDRIFPNSSLFSKYWYGYISADMQHEVDVLQGAYFMTRREILENVDWFDETYFLNGEDIDLSWKIKNKGWKIMYYPKVSINHIKKGTKKSNKRLHNEISGVRAMEIFYRNRMWNKYPLVVNWIVVGGIFVMRILRSILHYIKRLQ